MRGCCRLPVWIGGETVRSITWRVDERRRNLQFRKGPTAHSTNLQPFLEAQAVCFDKTKEVGITKLAACILCSSLRRADSSQLRLTCMRARCCAPHVCESAAAKPRDRTAKSVPCKPLAWSGARDGMEVSETDIVSKLCSPSKLVCLSTRHLYLANTVLGTGRPRPYVDHNSVSTTGRTS